MASRVVRRNETVLKALRILMFGALTAFALLAMRFVPAAGAFGIAIVVAFLAAFSPGIAVLAACLALALPLMAGDFLVGAVLLILGFAAIQYLGQDNGRVYLLLVAAFAGTVFGPAWAVPVIAGYLMGASEGAVTAMLACVALQLGGIVVGREALGVVHTGGGAGMLTFANLPENLLAINWMTQAAQAVDPQTLMDGFKGLDGVGLLVAQPILWAIGAATTALVRRQSGTERKPAYGLAGAAAGVLLLAAGSIALQKSLGGAATTSDMLSSAVSSIAIVLGFAAAWEFVFPPLATRTASGVRSTMSDEDADVDELLRLISAAEDQLATKHTVNSVVMITDMKSFSKMTEEDGSVVSAKTIQKHRDLLLPIIASYGGKGKSTGGDGLLAAFDSAADALHATNTILRTLADYNRSHPSERDVVIRIGVASGEVVLDKGGRPFIGSALNLAARVMNLGDGGQAFTTREVVNAAKAADVETHSHGKFDLKNIAQPVEVMEVLWNPSQEPTTPRIATSD